MRTELYKHVSSIYPTNFSSSTPHEQLKVLMSEQFIYLPIDFVEQAWGKCQRVMFDQPSCIYSNVFIIILLLCYAAQFQVTYKPFRTGYQFIILYFCFVLYVCTMSL